MPAKKQARKIGTRGQKIVYSIPLDPSLTKDFRDCCRRNKAREEWVVSALFKAYVMEGQTENFINLLAKMNHGHYRRGTGERAMQAQRRPSQSDRT